MNKRGDLVVLVFTIIVFVVCIAILFIIYNNSGNAEAVVVNTQLVENIFSLENEMKFYAQKQAEQVLINEYFTFLDGNSRSDNDLFNFIQIHFKEDYARSFSSYYFNEPKLNEFRKNIADSKFDFSFIEGNISIAFQPINLNSGLTYIDKKKIWMWGVLPSDLSEQKIKANFAAFYISQQKINVSLINLALPSLDSLKDVKTKCLNEDNPKSCVEKAFPEFDVYVINSGSDISFRIVSKELYLDRIALKNLKIDF